MLVKLLKMIQSELNFNYSLVPSPDGSHGTLLNEENYWSGQIGLLQRKELDLSIMELTFTHERAQVIFFVKIYLFSISFYAFASSKNRWYIV